MSFLENIGRAQSRLFHRLSDGFDHAALLAEAQRWGLGETKRQICITSRADCADPLTDGSGTLTNGRERDFTVLNSDFADTYVGEVYRALPYRVGRVRFMWLAPRSCYSFHRDTEPRLHIALETNPDALLMVQNAPSAFRSLHIPADGSLWWVDTRQPHNAVNGGTRPRIHLVASILVDEKYPSA